MSAERPQFSRRFERLKVDFSFAQLLAKTVSDYLAELERDKNGKPDQVRDGIEIYLELWKKALERGAVLSSDEISLALAKVEEKGGLYKIAED